MSKRRVYELAKEQGLSSKELLERLQAAGVDARAAASSVEEAQALKVLGESASANTAAAAGQSPGAAAACNLSSSSLLERPCSFASSYTRRLLIGSSIL